MKTKFIASIAAAAALVSAPVMAQADMAQREAAPVDQSEQAGGSGLLIALLAAAAIIGGLIIALDGGTDRNDLPVSP